MFIVRAQWTASARWGNNLTIGSFHRRRIECSLGRQGQGIKKIKEIEKKALAKGILSSTFCFFLSLLILLCIAISPPRTGQSGYLRPPTSLILYSRKRIKCLKQTHGGLSSTCHVDEEEENLSHRFESEPSRVEVDALMFWELFFSLKR